MPSWMLQKPSCSWLNRLMCGKAAEGSGTRRFAQIVTSLSKALCDCELLVSIEAHIDDLHVDTVRHWEPSRLKHGGALND